MQTKKIISFALGTEVTKIWAGNLYRGYIPALDLVKAKAQIGQGPIPYVVQNDPNGVPQCFLVINLTEEANDPTGELFLYVRSMDAAPDKLGNGYRKLDPAWLIDEAMALRAWPMGIDSQI
jgi:hypothetical protein